MKFYSEAGMERAMKIQRSNLASDREADQLVAGSRDHRDQRPADEAVARALRAIRLRRIV